MALMLEAVRMLPPPSESSAALVTGASSGIGVALARELASRGHGLVLVARRMERLQALAEELASERGVRCETIGADLADPEARERLVRAVGDLGLDVEVLVNNAGFGAFGSVHRLDTARQVEMVRLNCETVVDLHARYSAEMVERGRGAILNVASTAAFQPLPGSGTYAATKAFVLSLSEASHSELRGLGVTVTALCPGPVKTEFGEVAGVGEKEGQLPRAFWTSTEQVAAEAIGGLEKGKRVVVPGVLNRGGAISGQHIPRAAFLPLANRLRRAAL
jgi:short-subunit dehydrogenase